SRNRARAPTGRPARLPRRRKRPNNSPRRSRVSSLPETRTIVVEVLRYQPDKAEVPYVEKFEVPFTDDMSVLQGLQYIKDNFDGSLTFRWSCRMAICGSCGMMIGGVPQLG